MSSPLCNSCQEIPFDPNLETLSLGHSPLGRHPMWNLGLFGEVRRRKCPFCQLVSSICWSDGPSWEPMQPPSDKRQIIVQFIPKTGFNALAAPMGACICLAVDPVDVRTTVAEVYQARETFNQWIDFDAVNEWISTCDSKHETTLCATQTYNPAAMPRNSRGQPVDFRLIDVQEECIVYAPRHCRYIALSYVWGDTNDGRLVLNQNNEESLMQPGALRSGSVQAPIPNTIVDAMRVVRRLHERYLWVDSLCLLQDDLDELQESIAIMDLFYEMATLTIIAGSATDANAGLPGVQPRSRKTSRFVREIIPGLRMTTILDLDALLMKSHYCTRAWTMQEDILSKRALVFVNDQIYFRCPGAQYSEAMNWCGDLSEYLYFNSSLLQMILADPTRVGFSDYTSIIMYYSVRKHTFSRDILRAAQGMLRKYSILAGVHCFEGMSPPFEKSLLYESLSSEMMDRREGFPSYSWTGWTQQVDWNRSVEGAKPLTDRGSVVSERETRRTWFRAWILWFCKMKDGNVYRINPSGRLRKAPTSNPPAPDLSQLDCDQALKQLPVSISDTSLGTIRIGEYPLLFFWTVCINVRFSRKDEGWVALDRNMDPCGSVVLDCARPTTTSEGQFAVLAQATRVFWALLLQWKDGIAERRGTAFLTLDVLERCLPPGPRWKAIVLG